MPQLGQNRADAGSIGPVLAKLRHVMACLLGYLSNWLYIETSMIEVHAHKPCSIRSTDPTTVSPKTKRDRWVDSIRPERCLRGV